MPQDVDPARPTASVAASSDTTATDRWGWGDLASVVALLGLTIYFLTVSWRKWPDPFIDFGVVLYTPWRITQGAVLYRDVDCLYGPLSQYFNATIFAIFGTSLMTMVAANLAIFAVIVGTMYACFRRAWGWLAAFIASAVFVAVFGFAQYTLAGNYNYATPYATEATHGVLICLLLVAVLGRWVEEGGLKRPFFIGLLFGLALVLKPEFMLAAGVLMTTALVLHWRRHGRPANRAWLLWAGGTVLPSATFFIFFLFRLPVDEALRAAGNGWLSVFDRSVTGTAIQAKFLGADELGKNIAEHVQAILIALAVLLAVGGVVWGGDRIAARTGRYGAGAAFAALLAWLAWKQITWSEFGRCLLGLVLLYLGVKIVGLFRARLAPVASSDTFRLLLALLAASLMVRMALNGRLFQYGFYQAALATILIPAVLIGELGRWLRLRHGGELVVASTLALVVPGAVFHARHSIEVMGKKTQPIAEGADRFYAFPQELAPSGQLVKLGLDFFRSQPPEQELVVIPAGVMINYLTRRPSPVAPWTFFGNTLGDGREAKLVGKLRQKPPPWVLLVSDDLRDYGIMRYGEAPGKGQELLQWLATDYQRVAKTGGDPLDYRDHGAQIFKLKAAAPAR